ncbi:DNA mismatch repair endonuclease MutL [Fusibacter paucivorans]|uniref:DNA mismatch repair protein MutL n=1 Tax=Fusibacter paucivorans TaxID=76009 RepID=A0ABS5PQG9_9FIRM|nr:DNA mismatch repair endonuclease MutL [Fusibacter paucivorans]MBS7526654.1 DNA mismatch repair endonuclease MutL [Fusibacter paucivorans]
MSLKHIYKLDEITASKIAAGEVVEKPAMVVKELVENAIDAGSTHIHVIIEKGGKKHIGVIDNGTGIAREDLNLVFERHATSKIRTLEDLYQTASLGFRGEALASICAVSEVALVTKTAEDEVGAKVTAKGGKVLEIAEVGALTGTSITIQNLFFNTPARLKFLKSDKAEAKNISDLMSHLALSHPEIAIEYTLDGKSVFKTPGNGKLANAIFEVYDRNLMQNLFEVSHEALGIKLFGFASTFAYTKGNSTLQIVFVNGRYVKSDLIKEAIMLAYKPYLMHNRFPVCFFFIELTPNAVDVNIHPAKTEIKFHHEGDVKQLIYAALRKAFNLHNQIPEVTFSEKDVFNRQKLASINEDSKSFEPMPESVIATHVQKEIKMEPERHNEDTAGHRNTIDSSIPSDVSAVDKMLVQKQIADEGLIAEETPVYQMRDEPKKEDVETRSSEGRFKTVSPSKSEKAKIDFTQYDLSALSAFSEEIPAFHKPMAEASIYDGLVYVGTFLKTYLIFEKDESMYMIDQHAAHEKILYEQLMQTFFEGATATQMVLVPETIALHWSQADEMTQILQAMQTLGFDVEEFGPDTLVMRGIPDFLDLTTARELVTSLIEGAKSALDHHISEQLMSKACKNAIKAHDSIGSYEIEALLKDLKVLKEPYTCPHGRPIIISFSRQELEKRFKRIV